MVKCAIVLAAGENRRMGARVGVKAVLPIGPETFMSRHVRLLTARGVARIIIVASTRSAPALAGYEDGAVTVVVSPYSARRVGSSLSLMCGLDALLHFDARADAIVMDADIVYEDALLDCVLGDSARGSRLFAIRSAQGDSEEVRVYGRGLDTPVLIGKALPAALTDGLTLLGESLGMIHLAASEVRYCRDLIRWIAGAPPTVLGLGYSGALSEHEEVWQYLFSLRRLGVEQLPPHLLFAECDTPEDYARVCETIVPAITHSRDGSAHPRRDVAAST